jgi:hypothetical protein
MGGTIIMPLLKRPERKKNKLEITQKTKVKDILDLNTQQTKRIIKQMDAYGMQIIGYGIDHNKTMEQHAQEQMIKPQQLRNLIKSINRKL